MLLARDADPANNRANAVTYNNGKLYRMTIDALYHDFSIVAGLLA